MAKKNKIKPCQLCQYYRKIVKSGKKLEDLSVMELVLFYHHLFECRWFAAWFLKRVDKRRKKKLKKRKKRSAIRSSLKGGKAKKVVGRIKKKKGSKLEIMQVMLYDDPRAVESRRQCIM